MPNPNLTAIAVVLDRSGSMSTVREATVGGLNQFFRTQRELPGQVRLTLVQFDDQYEVHKDFVDLKQTPDLTQDDFVPRGWTALLDAVGKTIIDFGNKLNAMPEAERPGKVIVVVQTDGQENASKEYTFQRIQDLVAHQRDKYAWDFVFLGANMDAVSVGATIGVFANQSLSYNANAGSTAKTFQTLGAAVGTYRTGGSANSNFSDVARSYVSDDSQDFDPNVTPDSLTVTGTGGQPTTTPGSDQT